MTRKFGGGEKFAVSHQDHNRWQDAGLANAFKQFGGQEGVSSSDWASDGIVLVMNNTGRDLPRFAVLTIRGSIPDPLYSTEQLADFKNFVQVKGEEPTSTITGRFCILQTSARAGEVVPAMLSGATPVLLNVQSLTDEFADIETDNTKDQTRYLKTGSSGAAQLIHAPTVLGEQWCYVRLSNRPATSVQVAFAEFRSHLTSPTYNYPVPSDTNDDTVYPAFLFNSPDFIDDTTDGSFTADQEIIVPDGYDIDDGERVIVYSLRGNYIPPNTGSGTNYRRLLPIFKINGKWYCDYVPRVRATFRLATSSNCAQGDIEPFDSSGGTSLYEGGDNSDDTYWTLNVDGSGVITAYRKMRCLVTYTCEVSAAGFEGSDDITGYVGINTSHGTTSTANTYHMPHRCAFVIKNAGSTNYQNVALCAAGIVEFDPGENIRFEVSLDGLLGGGAGEVSVGTLWVTLTPIETNSW